MSRIGIIILHWNNTIQVNSLLNSLRSMSADDIHLYVVDNSMNLTFESELSYVDLLRPKENLGFAGGCNLGAKDALARSCKYLLFLNADIQINDDDIIQLADFLDEHVDYGAISPVLRESVGGQATYHKGGRNPLIHSQTRLVVEAPGTATPPPDYLPGTVLLIRDEAWKKNGPFDEQYFFSGEVADWFLRLAKTKWKFDIFPDIIIDHLMTGNEGHRQNDYIYYSLRNRYLLIEKFGGKKKKKLRKKWTKHLRRQMVGAMGKLDLKKYKIIFQAVTDGKRNRFGRRQKSKTPR